MSTILDDRFGKPKHEFSYIVLTDTFELKVLEVVEYSELTEYLVEGECHGIRFEDRYKNPSTNSNLDQILRDHNYKYIGML